MKKGIWIAGFCPLCMRKILPDTILNDVFQALSYGNLEKAVKLIYRVKDVAKLDVLLPQDVGPVDDLEEKPVLYPLCKNCLAESRKKNTIEKIKTNIVRNKQLLWYFKDFDLMLWASRPREEGGCIL